MFGDIGKGDWLICVDAAMRPQNTLQPRLVEGRLYRIEELGLCATGEPGVAVDGAPRAVPNGFYRLDRFRPAGRGGMFDPLLKTAPAPTAPTRTPVNASHKSREAV